MSFGDEYASVYDVIYSAKDYAREARFVMNELAATAPAPGRGRLLEVGCGTGRHAVEFARAGFSVLGVDLSDGMIGRARARCAGEGVTVDLRHGDIRALRAAGPDRERSDAAVSLFHVLSYQVENESVTGALEGVRSFLRPGGLFLFDFWYGPGVLSDRPTRRERTWSQDGFHVRRVAEPELRVRENVVTVHIEVEVRAAGAALGATVREGHRVRYFFEPELRAFLEDTGFEWLDCREWLTGKPPTDRTWNAYVLARSVG